MSKLYGLVVCGGQSSRMRTDKSLLEYHGLPQRYYLYNMLSSLCERVFISCNEQQAKEIPGNYEIITDVPEYRDAGPMTALLSAFRQYPDADFLVVGCDYPFLEKKHLQILLEVKLQSKNCISVYNDHDSIFEPLITVYQSFTFKKLNEKFKLNKKSLSKFLDEINAEKMIFPDPDVIKSIDTRDAYLEAKERLKSSDTTIQ